MGMSDLQHPDPEWWKRLKASTTPAVTDCCDYCGHTRALHGSAEGCAARSTFIVGNPDPCLCTNRANGGLYRNAGTLTEVHG